MFYIAADPKTRAFATCFMAPFEKTVADGEEEAAGSQHHENISFLSSSEDESGKAITKIAKMTSKLGHSRPKPLSQSNSSLPPSLPVCAQPLISANSFLFIIHFL